MTGVQTCALPICFPVTIRAGINPILAANNGATATPSGASASIGTQHYNQQSAQAAAVSAMYEYGNNTAELANRYLELAKKAPVQNNTIQQRALMKRQAV